MTPFEYLTPAAEDEAVDLLQRHGRAASVIAGGQTLLLAMKDRSARPSVLVSVAGIESMRGIRLDADGDLVIGATTTYAELAGADLAGWHAEIARMAGDLADRPVRTRGTIGGAICSGEPRYDMPALVVGTGARLEIVSTAGRRLVEAADFFLADGGTVLQPGELLVAVRFPAVDRFSAVAFEKFRQRTFDAALTSALCAISVEDDLCSGARITISAATPAPRPCLVTAGNLIGVEVTAIDVDAVAAAAADEALTDPTSLPDQYRHELAVTLTRRALTRALGHRS